jgi:hypothetical protein
MPSRSTAPHSTGFSTNGKLKLPEAPSALTEWRRRDWAFAWAKSPASHLITRPGWQTRSPEANAGKLKRAPPSLCVPLVGHASACPRRSPAPSVQGTPSGGDKVFVNAFLRNAEELFAIARRGTGEDGDFSVLVGSDGGIHMVYGSDWGLEPLRQHHGARAAYRVTRSAGRVALEGRSLGASCRLESSRPARALHNPVACIPFYQAVS